MSNEPTSEKSRVADMVKVIGAAVGILSALAAVATFVGVKPEKKKILEWEYVSKSSLVIACGLIVLGCWQRLLGNY